MRSAECSRKGRGYPRRMSVGSTIDLGRGNRGNRYCRWGCESAVLQFVNVVTMGFDMVRRAVCESWIWSYSSL